MKFDIRLPIGAMFVLIGGLLLATGLLTVRAGADGSFSQNVDAWWGGVMLLFGLIMLWLEQRARRY
jgi:hypothetical protein